MKMKMYMVLSLDMVGLSSQGELEGEAAQGEEAFITEPDRMMFRKDIFAIPEQRGSFFLIRPKGTFIILIKHFAVI